MMLPFILLKTKALTLSEADALDCRRNSMGPQHATVFLDHTLLTFCTLSKSYLPHSFANIDVLGAYLWFVACVLAVERG